ncbi:CocE/NonD family hydrolase [Nonomuraea phyllanthi]|uniref:CocE/NonD family hydrolase n=1 Tax=Nonomuraea phyllanthi TaxID=2219224 RepID=UPI001293258E|nr:CocE/NonD family hydrolase [Nonomuraea phyllanthi]QFY06898.1 CocE/NonD family hydrolase [Nonomuraea phyllanthi]
MRPVTLVTALSAALTLTGTPIPAVASVPANPAAVETGPELPPDPFFSYDRPAEYDVHQERVSVPLRDGSHLACDLHRPAAEGRFPVIVYDYNAYDQLEAQGRAAAYFVTRGYVAAVCNARGSGDSPGHLDPFSPQEQRDNYDLIEWLAVQPWSTGRVGQTGVSYGGHSSLLVAVNKPPHLEAIIPVDGISDWYENTIYRGGIYSARIRDWQRSTAPETLVTYAQHPLYDDFWRGRSVKSRWKDLDVPVLEIAGWYDRYRQGMVDNFRARKRNVWLVSGPWVHGWPAGQPADIGNGAYLAWWDHWLARRPGAPLPAAKVTSYEVPGTGWRQFDHWPPTGTHHARLNLSSDGTLSPTPGTSGTRTFEVNTEPAPGTPDERLEFTTEPLPRDVVLAGEIQARIRAAFTATDGNIAVVVQDVAPDGTATRITQGWLKASHRFGHERAVPVRPGKPYDLDIRTWPTHYRVAVGHTVRVTVSSDDYPEIDSDAPAGQVSVRLGSGGSTIRLTTL